MKYKIQILIVCSLICVSFIGLLWYLFFANRNSELTIKECKIQNYLLTKEDKINLINRLEGYDIFAKYADFINSYSTVSISTDKKDGKAWGTILLECDPKIYESISDLLRKLDKEKKKDSRVIGFTDEYGSIYIDDYLNENTIGLVFTVNLPYSYNKKEEFNKNIEFFLNLLE